MLVDPDEAVRIEVPPEIGAYVAIYAGEQILVMFDESGLIAVETFPVTPVGG